ncbi:MAG: hypothetical protein EOP83_04275 [Verrucomicrobiaceae bacterium]|nr:MAG: hypothetical protein EOP83_04275 [Verrucomicrobiaceae bacterium]
MHRRILVTLGLFLIASATAQDGPSPDPSPPSEQEHFPIPDEWPGIEFSEVRVYLYNPGRNDENLIIEKGKLHPDVVNPEGIKLDATQTQRLLTLLRHESPDEGVPACMFRPHHGVVFYDRDGKPIANVSICFLCEVAGSVPNSHPMSESDFAKLKRLVQDLGLPVFESATEADVHFAKQWPDAKLKAAIDQYISGEPELPSIDADSLGSQLQGLGQRIHPFLLSHLADEGLRDDLPEKDPDKTRQAKRLRLLCNLVGDTPPAAIIPLLAPFLDEADPSVRCDVAATIAKTGVPEIIPFVRKAFSDMGRSKSHAVDLEDSVAGMTVSACALEGLQVAMDRGVLDAGVKTQLFPDVKASHDGIRAAPWAKALIGFDSDEALKHFLSGGFLNAGHRDLDSILTASVEANLRVPREHLLKLIAELKSAGLDPDHQRWLLGPALVLLGQHHHPDDLELFQSMSESDLANHGMPGLLAWHGLHGYRERLSKQVEEKGYDSLNHNQRLYFAASEFTAKGQYYFWYEDGGRWRDALSGLKAMKRDQLIKTLEEIVAKFRPDGPSDDWETRKAQFQVLRKNGAFQDFTGFEEGMTEAADPKGLSLDRFAIEHAESFK